MKPWEMDWSGTKTTPARGAEAVDKNRLNEVRDQAAAAERSLRLYDEVDGAIQRFKPSPMKAWWMDAMLPNEDGGWPDAVGAFLGYLPSQRLWDQQERDDRDRINSARAERIGIRAQEQKGVQAKNDEIQFKLADISPYKSTKVNREIIARARREAAQQKLSAEMEDVWISRYGSTATPAADGRTFGQALGEARRKLDAPRLPPAPPGGRSTIGNRRVVIDINGNPIK